MNRSASTKYPAPKDAAVLSADIYADEVLTKDHIFLELFRAFDVEPTIVHIPSDLISTYDRDKRGTLIGNMINTPVFNNRRTKRFVWLSVCSALD